jgi:hypothetical protein
MALDIVEKSRILSLFVFGLSFLFLLIIAIMISILYSSIEKLSDATTNQAIFKALQNARYWTIGLWVAFGITLIILIGLGIFIWRTGGIEGVQSVLGSSTSGYILPSLTIVYLILFIIMLIALLVYVGIWYYGILNSTDYQTYKGGCTASSIQNCTDIYDNFSTAVNTSIAILFVSIFAMILSAIAIYLSYKYSKSD